MQLDLCFIRVSATLTLSNQFIFLTFTLLSRPALGYTQPPIQWVPGALSPGVKRSGREADHSPPASAKVKKNVDLHIHSPICLPGVVLN
jgi:hypothetical protein